MIKSIKTILLFAIAGFSVIACTSGNGSSTNAKASNILEKTWTLTDINGFDEYKSEYQHFYVSFKNGKITGKAFNQFSTKATLNNDGTVSFSPAVIMTKMLPPTHLSALESNFVKRSTSAKVWSNNRNTLTLGSGNDKLVFTKHSHEH